MVFTDNACHRSAKSEAKRKAITKEKSKEKKKQWWKERNNYDYWVKDTTVEDHIVAERVRTARHEQDEATIADDAGFLTCDLWTRTRTVPINVVRLGGPSQKVTEDVWCKVCGVNWSKEDYDEAAIAQCKGGPAARAEAYLTHDPEKIWKRHAMTDARMRAMGARRVRAHTIPAYLACRDSRQERADTNTPRSRDAGSRTQIGIHEETAGGQPVTDGMAASLSNQRQQAATTDESEERVSTARGAGRKNSSCRPRR